jgi:hypothetical protein
MNAKKGMDVSHSRNADNRRNINNIFYTRSRKDVNNSRTPATAEKPIAA